MTNYVNKKCKKCDLDGVVVHSGELFCATCYMNHEFLWRHPRPTKSDSFRPHVTRRRVDASL